jgi:hypothetical protein
LETLEGAGKTAHRAAFAGKTAQFLLGEVMPNKTAALNGMAARTFRSIPDEHLKNPDGG